eukprot:TRINITY_DN48270_c0_g1_i1.p1 TRINITY_DN48270_c0_g1~~TRINITY_DN48270_c0_g1_i1.p1  ORF type:complete len:1154 (+),score=261.95 TRINITY_DN48270_c0_g1_i1:97-3558(+)
MLCEEACVHTFRVTVDVTQAVGLVPRPVHTAEGFSPVLSVECFGKTERARVHPTSEHIPWATTSARPRGSGGDQVLSPAFDARFVFYVVLDPDRTREKLTVRVLHLPPGAADDAAPAALSDGELDAVLAAAARRPLVGECEMDIEDVYGKDGGVLESWCALTRPDVAGANEPVLSGWLQCTVAVAASTHYDQGSPRHNSVAGFDEPSSPSVVQKPAHGEGDLAVFTMGQQDPDVTEQVLHLTVWKAEDFALPAVPKTLAARVCGSGGWVSTARRPVTASQWQHRITLPLRSAFPTDVVELAVHNSGPKHQQGQVSSAFVSLQAVSHAPGAPVYPRWINLSGHYATSIEGARRALQSAGLPASATEASLRSHYVGRILASFEVQRVSLPRDHVPSSVCPKLPLSAWRSILHYSALPEVAGRLASSCRALEHLVYATGASQAAALTARASTGWSLGGGILLPPPPSDTTAYLLRADLYQGQGLQLLAPASANKAAGVQVEVCWGPLSTVSKVIQGPLHGDSRVRWPEALKHLRLELPVRADEIPDVFVNVVLVGCDDAHARSRKGRLRIGYVRFKPADLPKIDQHDYRPQWHQLRPDLVELCAAGEPVSVDAPLPHSSLQLRCGLSRMDDVTAPRDWYPRIAPTKQFEVRVHVWNARRLRPCWAETEGHGAHFIELRCGASATGAAARRGSVTPSWNRTLAVVADIPCLEGDIRAEWWPGLTGTLSKAAGWWWMGSSGNDEEGLRDRLERAARLRTVSEAELEQAPPIDVSVWARERCEAREVARLRLPVTTTMVVRDLSTFSEVEPMSNYAPRRPQWMRLHDPADGGMAGEILMSVDVFHPNLARFHSVDAYSLTPSTSPRVLECLLSEVCLDCIPCGVPEMVNASIHVRVGRHAKCCVAAYSRAPLHAFLITPVVLVFPALLPDDPLYDPHVWLEVVLATDSQASGADGVAGNPAGGGAVLASFYAPLRSVLAPPGTAPPLTTAPGIPVVFAETGKGAGGAGKGPGDAQLLDPPSPPPASAHTDPVSPRTTSKKSRVRIRCGPHRVVKAPAGAEPRRDFGVRVPMGAAQPLRLKKRKAAADSQPAPEGSDTDGRSPQRAHTPAVDTSSSPLWPLSRGCARGRDPATGEMQAPFHRNAGSFRATWVLREFTQRS